MYLYLSKSIYLSLSMIDNWTYYDCQEAVGWKQCTTRRAWSPRWRASAWPTRSSTGSRCTSASFRPELVSWAYPFILVRKSTPRSIWRSEIQLCYRKARRITVQCTDKPTNGRTNYSVEVASHVFDACTASLCSSNFLWNYRNTIMLNSFHTKSISSRASYHKEQKRVSQKIASFVIFGRTKGHRDQNCNSK